MDATAEQTGYKEKHAAYLNQPEGSREAQRYRPGRLPQGFPAWELNLRTLQDV